MSAHSHALAHDHDPAAHHHGRPDPHAHVHGVVDPAVAANGRGMWAVKWSFAVLAAAAILQLAVVLLSGSVALLADAIHNAGDAATAIPLAIAFMLARRRPTAAFTYGYGRVEDLAGVAIVLIILTSAIVAGYEAIGRLVHPRTIEALGAVAAAGVIGFVANEIAAAIRLKVGREIMSAALVADGYHARADGLTSLAVAAGALAVRLGFPLADPLVGLAITLAILAIVWDSSKVVFTRLLDGVDPRVIDEIRAAAAEVEAIGAVTNLRARWHGHRLIADAEIVLDPLSSLADSERVAEQFRRSAIARVPALAEIHIAITAATATHPDQF
jgi:cation diffusion facilitator family transporter